uniref:Uncharacterized protein n=1 Tax=Anguilla anguilla TaxID=7936 RepID=A0A0E9QRK7_ANGAN
MQVLASHHHLRYVGDPHLKPDRTIGREHAGERLHQLVLVFPGGVPQRVRRPPRSRVGAGDDVTAGVAVIPRLRLVLGVHG